MTSGRMSSRDGIDHFMASRCFLPPRPLPSPRKGRYQGSRMRRREESRSRRTRLNSIPRYVRKRRDRPRSWRSTRARHVRRVRRKKLSLAIILTSRFSRLNIERRLESPRRVNCKFPPPTREFSSSGSARSSLVRVLWQARLARARARAGKFIKTRFTRIIGETSNPDLAIHGIRP